MTLLRQRLNQVHLNAQAVAGPKNRSFENRGDVQLARNLGNRFARRSIVHRVDEILASRISGEILEGQHHQRIDNWRGSPGNLVSPKPKPYSGDSHGQDADQESASGRSNGPRRATIERRFVNASALRTGK